LSSSIAGLEVNGYLILIFVLLIVLALGCVMDSMAIVLQTIPVFYPLITELGFNAIWFGFLVVRVTEMGLKWSSLLHFLRSHYFYRNF